MTTTSWGPVQEEMAVATRRVPRTIADVVAQLTEVQEALNRLPDLFAENPVSDFNVLYTDITTRILEHHDAGGFRDPVFLSVLDVEFANRYFAALRRWGAGDPATPAAWRVLFSRVDDHRLRSLPCAVAGVNAHINYDLPFALVATWERIGHADDESVQHDDFRTINKIFEDAIPGLRRDFLTGWQRRIDQLNGGLDDWYENLLVQLTRSRAWTRAQRLWQLREDAVALEEERATLDHQAAMLGQFLLSRLCAFIQ
jgi:hypothetical protein